jgi:hypothetical protein
LARANLRWALAERGLSSVSVDPVLGDPLAVKRSLAESFGDFRSGELRSRERLDVPASGGEIVRIARSSDNSAMAFGECLRVDERARSYPDRAW